MNLTSTSNVIKFICQSLYICPKILAMFKSIHRSDAVPKKERYWLCYCQYWQYFNINSSSCHSFDDTQFRSSTIFVGKFRRLNMQVHLINQSSSYSWRSPESAWIPAYPTWSSTSPALSIRKPGATSFSSTSS